MKMILTAAITAIAALVSSECSAQTLEAVDKAEERVVEAWLATPLTFRRALFVSEPPAGFGIFSQKEDSVFHQGEPLVVYAEPVGYAWRENGDGTYSFGFDIDLLLKSVDGSILGGQENFQHLELTSFARNREFMLTLTLDVNDAPPGDYVVEYRTRDIASDKEETISLPFSISE